MDCVRTVLIVASFNLAFALEGQILQLDHRQFAADTVSGWIGDIGTSFDVNNLGVPQDDSYYFLSLSAYSNISFFNERYYGNTDHYYLKNWFWYNEGGGDVWVNQGYSHFRIDFNYKRKFSPEVFVQAQFDETRRMPFRLVSGGGFRYVYLRNEKTEFEVGFSAIGEHEKWELFENEGNGEIIERNLVKGASYLGFFHHFKHITLSLNQFYQSGYDQLSEVWRHRISGNFELNDRISEHLALTLSIFIEHDTNPVIPIKKTYYSVTNGIRITL